MIACSKGSFATAELLMKRGARVDRVDDVSPRPHVAHHTHLFNAICPPNWLESLIIEDPFTPPRAISSVYHHVSVPCTGGLQRADGGLHEGQSEDRRPLVSLQRRRWPECSQLGKAVADAILSLPILLALPVLSHSVMIVQRQLREFIAPWDDRADLWSN